MLAEVKNYDAIRKNVDYGWIPPADAPLLNDAYGLIGRHANYFASSVKLLSRERTGAKIRRRHDAPMTPLDRLAAFYTAQGKPPPKQARDHLAERKKINSIQSHEAVLAALQKLKQHCMKRAAMDKQ